MSCLGFPIVVVRGGAIFSRLDDDEFRVGN